MSNCSAASFSFKSPFVSPFPLLSLPLISFFSLVAFSSFSPLSVDSLLFLLLLLLLLSLSFLLFFFFSLFSLPSLSLSLLSLSLLFFPLCFSFVASFVGLLSMSFFLSSSLSLSSSENLSCFHSSSGGPSDLGMNPGLYKPEINEPRFLHMPKQRRRSASQLISVFVLAIRIVQSLYYLYPKFQASSYLLWLYSLVCVRPGRKPRRLVFSERGSNGVMVTLPIR